MLSSGEERHKHDSNALPRTHNEEDGAPSSKRLKLGEDDLALFRAGSIVTLRLENFVTYALTEFHMSPSLNMIIGPNGSGKSTFVCAVCLGLAGKPEYIGRSTKIEDYIKNGEDRSVIEVTLKRDPEAEDRYVASDGTTKVTRVLHRNRKASEYFLNGQSVTESAVKRLVSELNIQLDNLCQFLSQERVEEFARLKSDKLLVETARSVDVNMVADLEDLKALQGEELVEAKELELKSSRVLELKATRDKLTASVRALKNFKKKKEELGMHEKLLPYVQVKDHKVRIKQYKREYEKMRKQLKDLISDKKPFRHTQQLIEAETVERNENKKKLEVQLKVSKRTFPSYLEKLEHLKEKVRGKQAQLKYYEDRTGKIKDEIVVVEHNLKEEQAKREALPVPDQGAFERIQAERKEITDKGVELEQQRTDLNANLVNADYHMDILKRKLQQENQSLVSTDRIGILDGKRFEELRNAVLFMRSRPEMQGKVLEPPIMSISVKDPQFASYLGTCTDFATSLALTVVDSDSYRTFGDELLNKFRVNIRELSAASTTSPLPLSELRKLGFQGYLSDFLSGDNGVLKMLCQQHKLHTIPVSRNAMSSRLMDYLMKPDESNNLKFRRVIAGNYVYDFKRSAYGRRQIFSSEFKVRPCQFFKGSILTEERKGEIKESMARINGQIQAKKDEVQSITQKIQELRSELQSNKQEDAELHKITSKLNDQKKTIAHCSHRIKALENKLSMLRTDLQQDVTTKINDCRESIKSSLREQVKVMSGITQFVAKLQGLQREISLATIEHLEAFNTERSMNEVIGFFNEKEEQLRGAYEEAKNKYASMKETNEYRGWMDKIRHYTDAEKTQLADLAEKYQQSNNFDLSFISNTIDRLRSEIGMLNQDESVLEIMRQTEAELGELDCVVPRKEAALLEIRRTIQEKRSQLEPKLDAIVEKISQNFCALFKNVGSAGAVRLDKPEQFSDWKIEIMVKFRDNATLKRLDSHTQSGGERAVSTVLYMIALQDVTSAPFRVVDEINQGMDSRNERIVHKSMVESACSQNNSQYILVTPKLLTQLHYHEKVRIHCVMAGAWIPDPIVDHDKIRFGQTSNYVF